MASNIIYSNSFSPNAAFSFDNNINRGGMGILVDCTSYPYTISAVRIAFAHRNERNGGGHGVVNTISCYIATDCVLGSQPLPTSVCDANNTILSTEVDSFSYGVYDGTYSVHTFEFTACPILTGQNWLIVTQTGTGLDEEATFAAVWSGSGFPGSTYETSTGVTQLYIINTVFPQQNNWQSFSAVKPYVEVDGTFIGAPPEPETPDDLTPFPPSCCSVVENDYFWQPGVWSGDDYTDPYWGSEYVATGGGRWGRQLVVAGDNSVYYEAVM